MIKRALIVLSGGQDSTTCLFWAKSVGFELHALTFNYGQRHVIELEAAAKVAQMAGVASHEVLTLPGDVLKSTSPLVSDNPVEHYASSEVLPGGIEKTFVPMRNALFLTIAANRAVALGCQEIVTGVCEADSGGYPDCRSAFIHEQERTINFALGREWSEWIHIHTPLMHLTKAQSVRFAMELPGCMEALAHSHTCYDGMYPPNPKNHASLLRARGFHEAGVADPLIVRAIAAGLLPAGYPADGLVEGTIYDVLPEKCCCPPPKTHS